ncbi:hypothetical protein II906_03850 [bacterium]|nr:hypothetical protein [bacterium]
MNINGLTSFMKNLVTGIKNTASQQQSVKNTQEKENIRLVYGIIEPKESDEYSPQERLVYGIPQPEDNDKFVPPERLVYGIIEPEDKDNSGPKERLVYGIIEPKDEDNSVPKERLVYGIPTPNSPKETTSPTQKIKNIFNKFSEYLKNIKNTLSAKTVTNKNNSIIKKHSLLSEYNKLIPAKNSGYITTNEKKNTRAFYNESGRNVTNLAALKFSFPQDGPTRITALFNGTTSTGKIVSGSLNINYETGEGTLDGKKITFNTETGIITFKNKNDEAKATKGNSDANKALKTGSSSVRTAKDNMGRDIKIIDGKDNSLIVYNSKGERIAQVEQTKAIKGNSKSYSGLYTGYDSRNKEITGTLVYDASTQTYTLDGKKCNLNKDTGRITFI